MPNKEYLKLRQVREVLSLPQIIKGTQHEADAVLFGEDMLITYANGWTGAFESPIHLDEIHGVEASRVEKWLRKTLRNAAYEGFSVQHEILHSLRNPFAISLPWAIQIRLYVDRSTGRWTVDGYDWDGWEEFMETQISARLSNLDNIVRRTRKSKIKEDLGNKFNYFGQHIMLILKKAKDSYEKGVLPFSFEGSPYYDRLKALADDAYGLGEIAWTLDVFEKEKENIEAFLSDVDTTKNELIKAMSDAMVRPESWNKSVVKNLIVKAYNGDIVAANKLYKATHGTPYANEIARLRKAVHRRDMVTARKISSKLFRIIG